MTWNHAAGSYKVLVVTIEQINAAVIVLFHQLVRSFFSIMCLKRGGFSPVLNKSTLEPLNSKALCFCKFQL